MSTLVKSSVRVKDPVVIAWLVLMGATFISWYLGDGHGTHEIATIGVIVVAFFKVYLVGQYFMELREAPKILRAVFGAWTVLIATTLVTLYLIGGG